MAEVKHPVLSVCATVGSKLADLVIKDGQLVFVQDMKRIALDYNGKRVFYNQIEELESELERLSILAPITGSYYFVIETAVLWTYQNGWVQLTTPPEDIVFIGVALPELGKPKTLYVNKENKTISIWDEDRANYTVVADKTDNVIKTITDEEINKLF